MKTNAVPPQALAIAVLSLLVTIFAHAAPASISYQAHLTNAIGTPVPGPVDIVVRIFDNSGVLLYEETHSNVEATTGLFQIAIGTGNATFGNFDVSLFRDAGPASELEIGIDGETLAPRTYRYAANPTGIGRNR